MGAWNALERLWVAMVGCNHKPEVQFSGVEHGRMVHHTGQWMQTDGIIHSRGKSNPSLLTHQSNYLYYAMSLVNIA